MYTQHFEEDVNNNVYERGRGRGRGGGGGRGRGRGRGGGGERGRGGEGEGEREREGGRKRGNYNTSYHKELDLREGCVKEEHWS